VRRVLSSHGIKKLKRSAWPKKKDSIDDSDLVSFKKTWDTLDSTVKGTICEDYAKIRLSELGFDVWEPSCQNHRTDFVILSGKKITRIQVKAGTYDLETKCFRTNFSRRGRDGARGDYREEDVDFFMVYCAGLKRLSFYVIPASEIGGKHKCPRLFPHREKLQRDQPGALVLEKYLDAFHLLG
jgi:hypothetical protein